MEQTYYQIQRREELDGEVAYVPLSPPVRTPTMIAWFIMHQDLSADGDVYVQETCRCADDDCFCPIDPTQHCVVDFITDVAANEQKDTVSWAANTLADGLVMVEWLGFDGRVCAEPSFSERGDMIDVGWDDGPSSWSLHLGSGDTMYVGDIGYHSPMSIEQPALYAHALLLQEGFWMEPYNSYIMTVMKE